MIRSAYLRVYLPAADVPVWPLPAPTPSRKALGEFGFVGESLVEEDLVTEWHGRRYVCPRRPWLRVLEGVLAMHNAYSGAGRPSLIPEEVARRAEAELRELQRRQPGIRSHVLTSAWHVPVRWFVPFDPTQRYVDVAGGSHRLTYRTQVGAALERLGRAHNVLTEVGFPEPVLEELDQVEAWLADFPVDALVELDYGQVAGFFSDDDLLMDETAADVWASIVALEEGDWSTAGEHYSQVMTRWAPAMAVVISN